MDGNWPKATILPNPLPARPLTTEHFWLGSIGADGRLKLAFWRWQPVGFLVLAR
jgi:hypothetical protein